MIEFFRQWPPLLKGALIGFLRHENLTRAAALAFYTVLSLSPLLVIGLNVISRLYAPGQSMYFEQLADLAGPAAARVMDDVMRNAEQHQSQGFGASVVGLLALILGATALFSNLHKTMNRIFEVPPQRVAVGNWFRMRGISALMILLVAVLVLLVLLAQTALVVASDWLQWRSGWAHPMVASAFFIALFALIYKIVPDVPVTWRAALYGGLITTALFVLGRWLIGLYLSAAWIGAAFGAAGGLFLLMLWAYYSAIVVLFGVEITRELVGRQASNGKANNMPITPSQS